MNQLKIQKKELLAVFVSVFLCILCVYALAYRSREHAKQMICAAHVHLNSQSVIGYAGDHEGNVIFNYGSWPMDISYSATDELMDYGSTRQSFYCPSDKVHNAFDQRFWQFAQMMSYPYGPSYQDLAEPTDLSARQSYFRVITLIFLTDTPIGRPSMLGQPPRDWIQDIDDISNPSEYEMIVDETISDSSTYRFHDILSGGSWALYEIADRTNHMSQKKIHSGGNIGYLPLGGNIGYVDGHVAWRPFEQMQVRVIMSYYFWW